jgi:hypothetical protein
MGESIQRRAFGQAGGGGNAVFWKNRDDVSFGRYGPVLVARNLKQLNDSLGALEIQMTPEWRAEISALVP